MEIELRGRKEMEIEVRGRECMSDGEAERPNENLGMGSLQDCRGGCNLQCFRNCRIAEFSGAAGAANVRAMQILKKMQNNSIAISWSSKNYY